MQQFMRLVTVGRAQILVIERLDFFVFMRLSTYLIAVFAINGVLPFADDIGVSMVIRLTAPADATARAGHDFNGVETAFAVTDVFEHLTRVPETVRDADVQIQVPDGHG